MLCPKIVNTIFQHKSNYVAFMILQVSVLGGTREAGSMNYQFHNCNMKDTKNLYMRVIPQDI